MRPRNILAQLSCSVASGLLIGLAWQEAVPALAGMPGLGIFFLLQFLSRTRMTAVAFSFLAGFIGFALACPWLYFTIQFLAGTNDFLTALLVVGVWLAHASIFAAFALLFSFFVSRDHATQSNARRTGTFTTILIMPFLWVALESIFPSLFPFLIGYLAADYLPIAQTAEFGGPYFLSLVIAFASCAIPMTAFVIKDKKHRCVKWIGIILLVIGVFTLNVWGQKRTRHLESQWNGLARTPDKLNVMIVQAETETEQSNKRMINASRKGGDAVELSLWPESALGAYARNIHDFRATTTYQSKQQAVEPNFRPFPTPNSPLLAGADTWTRVGTNREHYVSAMLLDSNENLLGRHDKIELMPYGEYIPGETLLPFLRSWFGHSRILSRGKRIRPVGKIDGQQLGVVLCCEDMFPYLTRRLCQEDSDLLISLGNGMAFDSPIALRQHFRIARLRSIENRKFFVRCMSRGISVLLSPTGKVLHELPCLQESAMLVQVPNARLESSAYTKWGDWPVLSAVWFVVTMAFARVAHHRLKRA